LDESLYAGLPDGRAMSKSNGKRRKKMEKQDKPLDPALSFSSAFSSPIC
jgi:hypothetical protein